MTRTAVRARHRRAVFLASLMIGLAACGGDSTSPGGGGGTSRVTFTDASGDADAAAGVTNSPDILSGEVRIENAELVVVTVLEHYDPAHTEVLVAVDADINDATGNVTLGMGVEYFVEFGPATPSGGVRLTRCTPGCASQADAGTWTEDVPTGTLELRLPMSDIGDNDGILDLRVGVAHVYDLSTSSPVLDLTPEQSSAPFRLHTPD